MNGRMVWRVMWKEYRALRGLWIAVLVGSWLTQLAALLLEREFGLLEIAYGAALVTPVFYMFGAAAAVFAGEREDGTDRLLAGLPLELPSLAAGKLAFVALSTLAIVPAAGALALGQPWWPGPQRAAPWAGTGGIEFVWAPAILEGLAWGLFFSLVLRNVMQAACLAALAAAATVSLALHFSNDTAISGVDPQQYAQTLGARLAIVAVVLAVDLVIARRWLPEPAEAKPSRIRRAAAAARERLGRALGWFSRPLRWQGRLAWQHLRQSSGTLLAAAAVPLALGGLMTGVSETARMSEFSARGITSVDLAWEGPLIFVAAFLGCATFVGDTRRCGYRCLAEQGSGGVSLWLNRQMLGLLVLAWAVALWHVVWWLRFGDERPVARFEPVTWGREFGDWHTVTWREASAIVLAYAVGQASSLFFSSGIVAMLVGLVLATCFYAWSCLMAYLMLPAVLTVWPLTVGLLAASAVFAPRWLLDQRGLGTWLRTGGTFAAFAAATLALVPALRLEGIPDPTLNFDVSQFEETLDAEARKTADLYLRALDRLVPPEASVTERVDDETPAARYARLQAGQLSDQDRAWLEANQPALQLALEANARPTCAFTTWLGQRPRAGISDLGRLLIMHGLAAEVDGQLEAALERYAQALRFVRHLRPMFPQMFEAQWIEREALGRVLGWAARPGQSAELLGRAQKLLEDHARQLPPFDEPIKWEYRSVARAWQQENDVEIHQGPIDALFSRIPWERERARRLLVLRTNEALELVDTVTRDVAQGASPAYLLDHRVQPTTNVQILVTPILHKAFTWFNGEYLAAGAAVEREADNRAARIILALLAAELTGGRLPSSLEELQGAELAEVPQDPFRGEPFDYFPRGFPIQVDPNVRLGSAASKRVTAGQPVLWSTGSRVRIAPNEVARPTFAVFDGRMWSAVNDLAAYAAGLTYAIPRAPAEPVHVQPPE